MTKPRSGGADRKSAKPKGESAAVRLPTDASSDIDEAETVVSDDAEPDQGPRDAEPDKVIRRIRRRRVAASSVAGRRGRRRAQSRVHSVTKPPSGKADDESDRPDDESCTGEEKEPSDVTEPAAQDGGEDEAATPDDAEVEEDDATAAEKAEGRKRAKVRLRVNWSRLVAYGLIPGVALLLAGAAGFLKWQDSSARASQLAGIESLAAAKDSTIALLSYKSDTVEKDLDAAKSRLTGAFKESYSQLINDVVIPGAKRGHISTTATVPAAASVSATPTHAVTLLFVNQTAVVDKEPPTDSTSSVRVTLDKIGGHWLISGFDPV
jgi:Mce-associated membrane protein